MCGRKSMGTNRKIFKKINHENLYSLDTRFDVICVVVVRGKVYSTNLKALKKTFFFLHERHPQLTVQFNIILCAHTQHLTIVIFWYSRSVYDAF